MFGFGKPKAVVGLDIGSSAVKAVELRSSGKGYRFTAIGSWAVPPYTNVITQAGRQAVVVDVDAFALQNAYEVNYGIDAAVVVLLNAGASATNVNMISNGQSLFTRDLSVGGNAYTEAVQRELNLPFD